ncbi:MAG: BNR repeat-containing protein [Rhodopirellula sp. JB044]|uniref:BNR repeat-containing protein n=1 Tax=Rhodopirellula sp. JB044 TaxID=3342844 RepID=UPI00370A8729
MSHAASRGRWVRLTIAIVIMIGTVNNVGADELRLIRDTVVDAKALTFADGKATRFGNTVNGRTHQQNAVSSYRGYQYAAFVDEGRRICLGRRKVSSSEWSVIRFTDHRFETNDSHNAVAIGICEKDGTIHMAFDHHATPLNYRVSRIGLANNPSRFRWDASLFSPVLHTLGSVEATERVTYPRFFSSPDGNLMLYYRAVTSGNGDGMIERYDGRIHNWVPGLGKFAARDVGVYRFGGKESMYRCPYMNPPSFAGRRLHLSWVWRDRFEATNPANQHDLCYVYSDDFGRTWHNTDGDLVGRTGSHPIHLNTRGLVAVPISPDQRVSNSNSQYAYDDGSVHVVMRQIDRLSKEHRYHHYWRRPDGKWTSSALPFTGNRPKIVGTDDGRLVLVYCEQIENTYRLSFAVGKANSGKDSYTWERVKTPHPAVLGEALLDTRRWKDEQVLSVYYQVTPNKNIRTSATKPIDGEPSALHVTDYHLVSSSEESPQ